MLRSLPPRHVLLQEVGRLRHAIIFKYALLSFVVLGVACIFVNVIDCFDRALVFSKDITHGSWSLSATLVPHESMSRNRAISGIASHNNLAVVMASSWRGSLDYALFTYEREVGAHAASWSTQAIITLPENVHSCPDKGCLGVHSDTIAVSTWVINSYIATDRTVTLYKLNHNSSTVDWILLTNLIPNNNQYPAVISVSTFYQVTSFVFACVVVCQIN